MSGKLAVGLLSDRKDLLVLAAGGHMWEMSGNWEEPFAAMASK